MWNYLSRLFSAFRKTKPSAPAKLPVSTLDAETRAEALAHAKFLFGEGVWLRELLPGEVPSDTPEIGTEPMPVKNPPE